MNVTVEPKKPIDVGAVLDSLEKPSERRKFTLVEVLAVRDDERFAWEIIHYVNDQLIAARDLRPAERIVHLVNDCEYRLFRGGITDVLLQMDERNAALDALGAIGATRFERILRQGARLFDAIPAADRASLRTFGDWTERAGSSALDALNRELGDVEELGELLRRYIAAHRIDFAVD